LKTALGFLTKESRTRSKYDKIGVSQLLTHPPVESPLSAGALSSGPSLSAQRWHCVRARWIPTVLTGLAGRRRGHSLHHYCQEIPGEL